MQKMKNLYSEPRAQNKVQLDMLMKCILPQVDDVAALLLESVFSSLKKNKISKENFLRKARSIVGCQMLKKAVDQMLAQEEGERLFSGSRVENPVSRTSKTIGEGNEKQLMILQKAPLHEKLSQIISSCGIKKIAKDVDLCLSLYVEERMHALIRRIMWLSKQRKDLEKSRHKTVVTSDIKLLLSTMKCKFVEKQDRKQVEVDKRCNQVSGEERMMCTAANVATQAFVGGEDFVSKWKQAQHHCSRGLGSPSSVQQSKNARYVSAQMLRRTEEAGQELQEKDPKAVSDERTGNRLQEDPMVMHQSDEKVPISIMDVVRLLEREPVMSKTTLMYRFHEKMHDTAEP